MSRKVIVRIKGGLGNQLFCYAAARRLAVVNDAELVVDDVTGFARDFQYRRTFSLDRFTISARKATPWERMEPWERYRRGLAKFVAGKRSFHRRRYIEQEGNDFDPRLLELRVDGTVFLDGLWQSEGYFRDIEEIIRRDLQPTAPADAINRAMAERIRRCNAVAVHVRWFDRPGSGMTSHNASTDYYRRALDEIERRVDRPHFFLFSDDPESARSLLDLPRGRSTCVNHNRGDVAASAELWLMSQCRHFVIANSTFSWWGAWLAEGHDKTVLAPKLCLAGMTAWGFAGLIPQGWTQV